MSQRQPSLTDHIAAAIYLFQVNNVGVTLQDILTSLEKLRHELTEEYLRQYPERHWLSRDKH